MESKLIFLFLRKITASKITMQNIFVYQTLSHDVRNVTLPLQSEGRDAIAVIVRASEIFFLRLIMIILTRRNV